MKKWIIATYAIVLAVIGVSAYVYATKVQEPVEQGVVIEQPEPPTVEELLTLVNAERAKVGVAPLQLDVRLNQSAQRKVDNMIAFNDDDHIDQEGAHGYMYIPDTGIKCVSGSENLVFNEDRTSITSARLAINTWMNSDAHRAAMLDPKYDFTGFAIKDWAIVQHFCNI